MADVIVAPRTSPARRRRPRTTVAATTSNLSTTQPSARPIPPPTRPSNGQASSGQASTPPIATPASQPASRQSATPSGAKSEDLRAVAGLFVARADGSGMVVQDPSKKSYLDTFVSVSLARRFGIRPGDRVEGVARLAHQDRRPTLVEVSTVSGMDPGAAASRRRFEDLTPLFPDVPLRLEMPGEPTRLTGRVIDLAAPIGKGQRGLVVAPPKAGKTTVLKEIVAGIETNNPECQVLVLLVDERPEEVTDMRRHVQRAEVWASTFDRHAEEHCHLAELALEYAKRQVEAGADVVIVLDGITRLARAYNLGMPTSGRIMSGGIDAGALYPPKKFFGAARNLEEGGSLTIIATALVETNSKMDEHIFEEFKGTGNMELRLDRRTADRRIFPAVDVVQSGTRHDELLLERGDLSALWKLRRVLAGLETAAALELLLDRLSHSKSNAAFLAEIQKTSEA